MSRSLLLFAIRRRREHSEARDASELFVHPLLDENPDEPEASVSEQVAETGNKAEDNKTMEGNQTAENEEIADDDLRQQARCMCDCSVWDPRLLNPRATRSQLQDMIDECANRIGWTKQEKEKRQQSIHGPFNAGDGRPTALPVSGSFGWGYPRKMLPMGMLDPEGIQSGKPQDEMNASSWDCFLALFKLLGFGADGGDPENGILHECYCRKGGTEALHFMCGILAYNWDARSATWLLTIKDNFLDSELSRPSSTVDDLEDIDDIWDELWGEQGPYKGTMLYEESCDACKKVVLSEKYPARDLVMSQHTSIEGVIRGALWRTTRLGWMQSVGCCDRPTITLTNTILGEGPNSLFIRTGDCEVTGDAFPEEVSCIVFSPEQGEDKRAWQWVATIGESREEGDRYALFHIDHSSQSEVFFYDPQAQISLNDPQFQESELELKRIGRSLPSNWRSRIIYLERKYAPGKSSESQVVALKRALLHRIYELESRSVEALKIQEMHIKQG